MVQIGKGKILQALTLAGSQHRYQKILVVLICLTWIMINFIILGPTLMFMDPIFKCASTGQRHVQEAEACPRINQCQLIDKFTITSQLKLFCDLQWARDTIQSIFSLGAFVGLLIMNTISDTKGRKKALFISLLVTVFGIIFTFLGAYFHVKQLIIIAQFLIGFGSYTTVTICMTILSDFTSDALRTKAIILVNSAWGFSTFMLGVYYLTELKWQYFYGFIIFLPLLIISSVLYVFIVQSPYILFNQNNPEGALQSLAAIAIQNKRQNHLPLIRKLVYSQQKRNESNEASLKNVIKLVRKWEFFKPMILLTLSYGIGNLSFFGLGYAISVQGLGYGYNSILSGCNQIISFIYLSLVINRIPRRKGIAGFYCISFILGLLFLIPAINSNFIAVSIVLGGIRIVGTIAYNMILCFMMESFTVEIQSTSMGLIEAFSLYGVFVAPLMIDLADKIGIDPIAFISFFVIFAVWPNAFLKETLIKEDKNKQNESEQNIKIEQNSLLQSLTSKQIKQNSSNNKQSKQTIHTSQQ